MPDKLPLFPLSLVAFPGELINLHIFEPRYKQLIHDVKTNNTSFGIPVIEKFKSFAIGSECILDKIVTTYDDGKLDITIKCIGWFEVIEYIPILYGKLYPAGLIERQSMYEDSDGAQNKELITLITELYEIMNITNVKIPNESEFKIHKLVHKLGLHLDQEIELLRLGSESQQHEYLIAHLQNLIPIVKQAEILRKRAELNGHFQMHDSAGF